MPATIDDTYAEAFRSIYASVLITARDGYWLDRAVQAYYLMKGGVPQRLEDLVSAGLVDAAFLSDTRSRPFHYEPGTNGYLLSAVDDRGKTLAGSVIERSLTAERP